VTGSYRQRIATAASYINRLLL